MKLVVGLGNPGKKYQNTRHNIGFWTLDAWAAYERIDFQLENKFKAEVALINNQIRLVKPITFMNCSGESVFAICNYFQIPLSEILIIHDEIDLPIGSARIKFGGGNAGHKGLNSISTFFDSNDYWRLRIGIGRPINIEYQVSDYVLSKPTQNEETKLIEIIDNVLEFSEKIINNQIEEVKQFFHQQNKLKLN